MNLIVTRLGDRHIGRPVGCELAFRPSIVRTFGRFAAQAGALLLSRGERCRPIAVGRTSNSASAHAGVAGLGARRSAGAGGGFRRDFPHGSGVAPCRGCPCCGARVHADCGGARTLSSCSRPRSVLRLWPTSRRSSVPTTRRCCTPPRTCSCSPIRYLDGGPVVRRRSGWRSSWSVFSSQNPSIRPRIPILSSLRPSEKPVSKRR